MNQKLPVAEFCSRILNTVEDNPVTIITAETGAGKSTQVPQFLLETGYNIVVTQPRRLATRSIAERVAWEYQTQLGEIIGYRMSGERCDSKETRCLFCTDGLALVRELVGQNKTDILVIDEVHEWNLNIEVLIAWVKKELASGRKLKVVLMSATLEAERLSAYFDGAPIISVPGRSHPITEITERRASHVLHVAELVRQGHNVLVFEPGKEEIRKTIEALMQLGTNAKIFPLHGDLTSDDQSRCFGHYGGSKVIVSTNVAQTSVTIDGITVVVDTGMERRVETSNGVEGLFLRPISWADRVQRMGRAGRTAPGLYVDYCKDAQRPEFPVAEILRLRLDQVVLRLAEAGLDAEELQFFHQPDIAQIHEAKRVLKALGCMTPEGRVTAIGHQVAKLPVSVRNGRMIVEAIRHGVLKDVIAIAAILEAGEIHMRKDEFGLPVDSWRKLIQNERESDVFAQLALFKAACNMDKRQMEANGIHVKAFFRAQQIREQITDSLRGKTEWSESTDRTRIHRCIVTGLIDHLFRNVGYGYQNGDDVIRVLHNSSVLRQQPNWIVGMPRDFEIKARFGGTKIMRVVTFGTSVTPELVVEIAPHLLTQKTGVSPRFDATFGDVVTSTQTLIGKVVVKERAVVTPGLQGERDLIREGLHRQFVSNPRSWPIDVLRMPSLIQPGIVVPEIIEHCIGRSPRDSERFMAYGTLEKIFGWSLSLTWHWTLNRQEAVEKRNLLLSEIRVTLGGEAETAQRRSLSFLPRPAPAPRPLAPVTAPPPQPSPAVPDDLSSLAMAWGATVKSGKR
ncbi:MAG: helicase-related protein [Patescibacteria group bacterium]